MLGQGVLGALQTAAAAGLLAHGVRTVPESVTIKGQLVDSRMTHQAVAGFDLSPVNRYKWHPTMEHIDHARWAQDLDAAVGLQSEKRPQSIHRILGFILMPMCRVLGCSNPGVKADTACHHAAKCVQHHMVCR